LLAQRVQERVLQQLALVAHCSTPVRLRVSRSAPGRRRMDAAKQQLYPSNRGTAGPHPGSPGDRPRFPPLVGLGSVPGFSTVPSLRNDLASPALRVLLLGERPLASLERILARAQLDAKRRAPELERLAQRILEI